MRRDIAVVVPASLPVQKLFDEVADARTADPRLATVDDFRLFDLYRPTAEAEAGEKSLAFAVELTARGENPLTDEEADAVMHALLEVLERVGARLRS